MKRVNLSLFGFLPVYWLYSDLHVEKIEQTKNAEGGEAGEKITSYVPSKAKGKANGTCPLTVGEEDIKNSKGDVIWKAGEKYAVNIQTLFDAVPEDKWEDAPVKVEVKTETKELTEDEKAKVEIRAKRRDLTKVLNAAKDKVFALPANATDEALRNAKQAALDAQAKLDEFNEQHKTVKSTEPVALTEDQQAKLDAYLAQVKVVEGEQTKADELAKVAEEAGVKLGKRSANSTNFSGSYEAAQEIRKMYSEGAKASEIADKFGCSPSLVMQYVKYQTYPLVNGDTAYTSLINDVFPEGYLSPVCESYNENGRAVGSNYENSSANNGKWMTAEAREKAIADANHQHGKEIAEYWESKKVA